MKNVTVSASCKWNSRNKDKATWVAQVERAWRKQKRTFRLIAEVTERTIDKRDRHPRVPDVQLAGWWTSLTLSAEEVIEHCRYHGTHEQLHSEIKSDLDLERLPFGKFDTNDSILQRDSDLMSGGSREINAVAN